VEAALGGHLLGVASAADRAEFLSFRRGGANVPRAADALWIYAQMVRWGQLSPSAAAQAAASLVFRADLLERYVGPLRAAPPRAVPFDGIELDERDIAGYLARFKIRTRYSAPGADA
jgi:NitT/TauT family transport system ATP-binding protein